MKAHKTDKFVISSRVRLARNVQDIPFPWHMSGESPYIIMRDVYNALESTGNYELHKMDSLSELERTAMMEQHLISNDLLKNTHHGAVILSQDKTVSIMLNEEDHVRAQCIFDGNALADEYEILNEIDDVIASQVKYSFDQTLGYITCCPTNLGTGMRASVMMFLPALTLKNNIAGVIADVGRVGITVRGVYGEGSNAEGFMYQVSNQRSLGMTENDIIENVNSAVKNLTSLEAAAREQLLGMQRVQLTDTVHRAYGLLTNAYKMNSKEFMTLMGELKLGTALDLIKMKNPEALDRIIIEGQPANLLKISGKELNPVERDIFRSEYVKKEIKKIT